MSMLRWMMPRPVISLIERYFNPTIPLKRRLLYVIPPSMLIGAGMELFMIQTGFYKIVTRKEGERRAEADFYESEFQKRRREKREQMEREKLAGAPSTTTPAAAQPKQ